MCDYCGCRRSDPTAELATEHARLLALGELLDDALHDGEDATTVGRDRTRPPGHRGRLGRRRTDISSNGAIDAAKGSVI